MLDARAYAVDFTDGRSPDELSLAETPLAHFDVFDVFGGDAGAQERLLELAREHAPRSLGTPGLVSIAFHRSLDAQQVVDLGLWTSFDGFGELLGRGGSTDEDPCWRGVADFTPDFLDVVTVVGAPR